MADSLEKKYYKIREVSALLDLPAPTLRFWENEFPDLKPQRNEGGTRFYTPADIETLRIIKYLVKDKGLKLAAAREMLHTNREGLSRRSSAIDRLRTIRATLQGLLDALNQRRN
ncbi:MAG: MerR family transcriptional regulator [Bacteroides sp.]|nr:MerR family transcriptional regulator [Bacteroidales bacterium]MBD5317410.1 MerR family transcriptional regulator [Bacteroides sp.]